MYMINIENSTQEIKRKILKSVKNLCITFINIIRNLLDIIFVHWLLTFQIFLYPPLYVKIKTKRIGELQQLQ